MAFGTGIATGLSALPVVRTGAVPVTFGGVTFSTEEVPDHFNIGAAEQMVATHDLPGGGRVLNAYGNKPKNVTWSGRLWGPNIKPRVQALRAYQVNGSEELLSWWFEKYYAVVTSFEPGYMGGYNEYTITVEITRDANGAFTVASQTSIDQQVATLQNQMATLNTSITALDAAGSAAFQQAISAVNSGIANASPLSTNLNSNAQSVITSISAAITLIDAYQATLLETAGQYVDVTQLISTLTSMQSLIQGGEALSSTTVQGGSLFGLASSQYGDPSLAFSLARSNGLHVPFVTGNSQTPLNLPTLKISGQGPG